MLTHGHPDEGDVAHAEAASRDPAGSQRPPLPEQLVAMLNANRGGHDDVMELRFLSASWDELRAELDIGHQHRQPYGIVHGGVYASIAESLCSIGAAIHAHAQGRTAVGLENATTFLRAARQGRLHARAVPLKLGRRTHVWTCDIRDDAGRLLAQGRVRLMILDKGAKVAGREAAMEGGAEAGPEAGPGAPGRSDG